MQQIHHKVLQVFIARAEPGVQDSEPIIVVGAKVIIYKIVLKDDKVPLKNIL